MCALVSAYKLFPQAKGFMLVYPFSGVALAPVAMIRFLSASSIQTGA
jgi:hypothetical protein